MYNDMPVSPTSDVPEDCIEECNELCVGKSIKELRAISNFFSNKALELQQIAENDLTMEDFEKAKNKDLDGDGKAGVSD